jgi:NADPH:quinone reductase-like Zn-dependent oxidoreductase
LSRRNGGAYAEFATTSEDRLEAKPTSVTFEQAAASPDSGTIAIQGLRDEGRVRPGHHVLINGAGGGVGTFAVQVAKAYGADVTAVDRAEKLEMLRAIGADHVLDHTREDFARTETPYDLILDIPGDRHFREIRGALAPEGTYVLIGHDAFGRFGRRWIGSMGRFLMLLAMSPFVKQLPGLRGANDPGDRLKVLRELLEAGTVIPVIDRTFPLAEVPAAIRYLEEGRVRGKVVILIDG